MCAEGREGKACACKPGYRPQGNICELFTCNFGEVKQGFSCVCAEGRAGGACACKPGFRPNGNICENFSCPVGELKQGATCVCADGKERKGDGSCGCKAGHRTAGNICVAFTCPTGKTAEGEICVCNSGTRPEGSNCVAFTCPAEKIPQGAACVCKPDYRTAAGGTCIPKNYDTLTDIDTEHLWHYGLDAMNVRGAYHRGFFGQNVTIGIADSGVITTHADFGDRIVSGYNSVAGSVTSKISDSSGHGTFVALVAAAGIGGDQRGVVFGLPRLVQSRQIEITITLAAASGYFHGVAPAAAVMPLQFGNHQGSLVGNTGELFDHAVSKKIQIVNNSWGTSFSHYWGYAGHGGTVYRASIPPFSFSAASSFIKIQGEDIRRRTGNADMVYVWASGNDGWHYSPGGSSANVESINNGRIFRMCAYNSLAAAKNDGACGSVRSKKALTTIRVSQQELFDNTRYIPGGSSLLLSLIPSTKTLSYRNDPGGYSDIPLYEPTLLKKMLVVGAVNSDNKLAYFSNGCGPTKMWCLVAPGRTLSIAPRCRRALCRARDGTSYAAPHVSGALAVIKSAAPAMPMEVVRAVLLTTARDLGAKGIDDVFGWGIPDVDKAVSLAVAATLAGTAAKNLNFRGAKIQLPASWKHLESKLKNIEMATGIGVDAYYNTKLSDWAIIETAKQDENLMRGTETMFSTAAPRFNGDDYFFALTDKKSGQLISAGARWGPWSLRRRFCADKACLPALWKELNFNDNNVNFDSFKTIERPFFVAAGDQLLLQMHGTGLRPFGAMGSNMSPYRQFGLRWTHRNIFDYQIQMSRIYEDESFWGVNLGSLGQTKTKTDLGSFSIGSNLSADWRIHASYRQARGRTSSMPGLLSRISGLRAEIWSAALQRRNIFRANDSLRLLVRRRAATQGQAKLNVVRADGDFTCGFYRSVMSVKEHAKLCGAVGVNLLAPHQTIDIKGGEEHIFAAAYATHIGNTEQIHFAIGAEYQPLTSQGDFFKQIAG